MTEEYGEFKYGLVQIGDILDEHYQNIEKLRLMIMKSAETIDKQSNLIMAVCAVIVAKDVCTADELAQAIETVKR